MSRSPIISGPGYRPQRPQTAPLQNRARLHQSHKRLHKILTGISEKVIWELLKEGQTFDAMLEKVPDEFYKWVIETKDKLLTEYYEIQKNCIHILNVISASHLSNRKMIAEFIKEEAKEYSGICFAMLDGKPYDKIIWKLIIAYPRRLYQSKEG